MKVRGTPVFVHRQRRGGGISGGDGGSDKAATADELLSGLSARVQRFCQDSLIAFPKSLATAGRSPRYQDTLKVSEED